MPRVRSFHLHNMRYLAIIFVFGLFTISHCTVRAQAKVTTAQVNLTWDRARKLTRWACFIKSLFLGAI